MRPLDLMARSSNRAPSRAPWPLVAAGIGLLAVAILVLGHEIEDHLQALASGFAALGGWGGVAFVGLFVLATSLLVPESVMGVVAGALFGLPWGVAATLAGSLVAAAVQYALARGLLRARIERALAARPSLAAIQRAVIEEPVRLQVLLRLTPLNPAAMSYLLGAAGVGFWSFLIACLALTPHLFIEVYVGHAGRHLARMAVRGAGATRLEDLALLGGLAVGIVVLITVSRAAHRTLSRAVADSAAPGSDRSSA